MEFLKSLHEKSKRMIWKIFCFPMARKHNEARDQLVVDVDAHDCVRVVRPAIVDQDSIELEEITLKFDPVTPCGGNGMRGVIHDILCGNPDCEALNSNIADLYVENQVSPDSLVRNTTHEAEYVEFRDTYEPTHDHRSSWITVSGEIFFDWAPSPTSSIHEIERRDCR